MGATRGSREDGGSLVGGGSERRGKLIEVAAMADRRRRCSHGGGERV
jgi:hypothetical protein